MEYSEASYQIIADLLAARTGQHLGENRQWRLPSALSGVFRKHSLTSLDQLACLLDAPAQYPEYGDLESEVVEALLNNETYFFRDKPTFDQIPTDLFAQLRKRRAHNSRARNSRAHKRHVSIWCAGCSTGQEVYSLAMLIEEHKDEWEGWSVEILGTDISQKAIERARTGVYGQFEIQRGLSVAQMLNHFETTRDSWQVSDKLRRHTRFEVHNLLTEPPARCAFDLILCRNVLLYFDAEKRSLAFDRLRSALASDGYLMLGNGETVAASNAKLVPSPGRASIFEPSAQTTASRSFA